MAVPSRVFVGVVVFGLIAMLAIVPFTVLVLTGYRPEPDSVQELFFPPDNPYGSGDRIALSLASLFSIVLTIAGWRALLAGARRDARLRTDLQGTDAETTGPAGQEVGNGHDRPSRPPRPGRDDSRPPPPPPGYH